MRGWMASAGAIGALLMWLAAPAAADPPLTTNVFDTTVAPIAGIGTSLPQAIPPTGIAVSLPASANPPTPTSEPPAVRDAPCDRGSLPESTQGRTPAADFKDGRAAKGYTCNAHEVGHFGKTGGYKVLRYVDGAGHVCGYYDTSLLFPKDAGTNAAEGLGVYAMNMRNPAHPVHTATLSTPAMLSPHESLLLNAKRGLLVADMGYPTFNPGFVDVYDISHDCLHPTLDSSTPLGILGHESGFAPDGRTFYVSSTGGGTFTALDLANPHVPRILFTERGVDYHGMRVSDNGNRLYVADIGNPGLTILDISQIQKRLPDPQVPLVSHITWPNVSIPQVPIPMTINGHKLLFEDDEYSRNVGGGNLSSYDPNSPVGAARIINIDNDAHPYVVSNIRLAVNQPKARAGDQQNDPDATFALQGYADHYCSIPREVNPELAACSFIMSGERVFDIRDPAHPREVAYFNKPGPVSQLPGDSGAFSMSQAAWDLKRHQVWYSDGNSGLWIFKVTGGEWPAGL